MFPHWGKFGLNAFLAKWVPSRSYSTGSSPSWNRWFVHPRRRTTSHDWECFLETTVYIFLLSSYKWVIKNIWQLRTLNIFGKWSKILAQGGSRTIQFFQKLSCMWWHWLSSGIKLALQKIWGLPCRILHTFARRQQLTFVDVYPTVCMGTAQKLWESWRSNLVCSEFVHASRWTTAFLKLTCLRKTEIWNAHYAVSLLPVLSHDGQSNFATWLHVDSRNVKRCQIKMFKGMIREIN